MTGKNGQPSLTYADAGVNLEARAKFVERLGPIAKATHGPQVLSGVGPFGGMFKLGDYKEPVLVSSTDSVGTKVKIASLLGRFDTIGIDLVNQSVDDIITTGAEPLFFLDYIASSSLSLDEKESLVQGVADACKAAGCALIGGETADMPDVYAPGDLDFVGFVVGAVEQSAIIDGSAIKDGDALLALPSSGLHTNGYSLVRRVFSVGIDEDPATERARLEREEPELGSTLGEALLIPHRSYVAEVQAVREHLKGITHITGGGLVENVPRMLPSTSSGQAPATGSRRGPGLGARIDSTAWERPPLFSLIQREGNIAEEEMFRTFNMGIGLVVAVEPSDVDTVRAKLPEAIVVGEVAEVEGEERVVIS
ncbi:MAG: phosphoribosylformylglycinamidine cyclo-ligase [Chloroflexi bacterium]|nr:phosphoribosylformylglycinamidine cyclo-ligase [Chloroflexota bacterium]